jgi:hypothetical protein
LKQWKVWAWVLTLKHRAVLLLELCKGHVSSSQEVRHFRGAGAGRPRFLNGGEGAPAQHRPRLHGIRIAVEMRR